MKKWIFPIVFIIAELIFSILFLTPSIVNSLPQFFLWIRDLINIILTAISKFLHLPTFTENGVTNYIIANTISLFILNFLIFVIYFIVFTILDHKKNKHKATKKPSENLTPKSEFDSVFFEKRVPILRLAFIWLPLNLWLLYFFLLNSADMQANFLKIAPNMYSVFEKNIDFYKQNAGVKFVILIVGFVVVGGLYWIICSFFAALLKKPIARSKAKRALKEHERRMSKLQSEETIIENIDILEHAKFTHKKSIADTIATIDIKEINEKDKQSRQNYFDYLSEGIVDLGVQERKSFEVAKPNLEKKPLRIIYPSLEETKNNTKGQIKQEKIYKELDSEKIDENTDSSPIILDSKLDVLNTKNKPNLKAYETNPPEEKEEKIEDEVVKPLNPVKLRKPVKVVPVKPRSIPLKDLVSEDSEGKVEKND